MTDLVEPQAFADWLSDAPGSIGEALLMLSSVLTRRAGVVRNGRFALDEIADTVATPTTSGIVSALFNADGFRGDVDNYHAEENSFLDQVLLRRLGMPITLSALVVEIGIRVGVPLTMVGMPGHVLVGTERKDHFIDAYGGVEVDSLWVHQRFASIFGPHATMAPGEMPAMDVTDTVNRVCNNLMRTWSEDPSNKMDRLLELRTLLPAKPAEHAMLIEVATARGRFDLAARLRETRDPDDPEIDGLWARLN